MSLTIASENLAVHVETIQGIKVITMDLSGAWDTISMQDMILENLRDSGINIENLLFRGFDAHDIEKMFKYGTDIPHRNTTFCSTADQVHKNDTNSGIFHALQNTSPALVLYDINQMHSPVGDKYVYQANPGTNLKQAIIAIVKITGI